MPTYNEWLKAARLQLRRADIPSTKLDAEIILAHTIRKNRTYIHAHGDILLEPRQYEIAEARLGLRIERTPIAYIVGHKEFYGRLFKVTPATLIPRPESESMIDLLKATFRPMFLQDKKRLVDVGTGSGCLGITAKLELPDLDVTLLDISKHALHVATTNANNLGAGVTIAQSNLLESYPLVPDIILANLPYVDPAWERSPETNHEPQIALFADNEGLALINKLILDAKTRLAPRGHLFLEADPKQHEAILTFSSQHGFEKVAQEGFIIQLQKS